MHFSDWVWTDHLDSYAVREWLRWYIEDPIYDSPEDYGIEEKLNKRTRKLILEFIEEKNSTKLQYKN